MREWKQHTYTEHAVNQTASDNIRHVNTWMSNINIDKALYMPQNLSFIIRCDIRSMHLTDANKSIRYKEGVHIHGDLTVT